MIEALIPDSAPTLLPSGAIVRMDTHNIGGLRRLGAPHWGWDFPQRHRWETADIAVLVFIYRRNTLIAKKIGLLQSKRLFPTNQDVEDDDEIGFLHGMNAFIRRDGQQAAATLHRTYCFDENCTFAAIQAGHRQIGLIDTLNRDFGKAVFYLLYGPPALPYTVTYPLQQRIRIDDMPIGNRVVDADDVHRALTGLNHGQSPSYSLLKSTCAGRNWALETWAADLLLTCQVGQQFDDSKDDRVRYFLERRSGPIGAALAVSITLPEA
ncbi:hypothetical protein L1787_16395 [Acuticoccus sp. M5D2P5]|uniref:hypothetical protein n=1 Tax=Acuticoccus kalidii TaxID=2910977 RepID=UPI001F29F442|nr:hypothetical protein [Acuticoccus kalidii]MCF3934986.1 hypothetical protein [Acuticoccus kalidii]